MGQATSYRSHTCGQLRAADIGANVKLAGWVHRKRDHGGLLFLDLRDDYGLTQLVFQADTDDFVSAERVASEAVVQVTGLVVARAADTRNDKLPTGEVEVQVASFTLLSDAQALPLPVFGEADHPESTRLAYRYLDLRREEMHAHIKLRHAIINWLRQRMLADGFQEFQTPILTASSPEGARDFLVPSRLHPGEFYALPQAPQQFKQLLMIAGFDKYFQIAPCFRDEDARADRSPGEFYQLDIEMSFVDQNDVLTCVEPILRDLFTTFGEGKKVADSFVRLTYAQALSHYGTDKPDLRLPIKMQPVSDIFRSGGFRLFADMLAKDKAVQIQAIPAPGGGTRAFCDRMNGWAQEQGQAGMGYIFFKDGAGQGPIAKNLGEDATRKLSQSLGLKDGDAVFFCAGIPAHMYEFAAKARVHIGRALGLLDESQFAFCWILDFPFYERNSETGQIDFSHNPFSMPQGELQALDTQDPLTILGQQYDIVCNGVELSSGAIRNHRPEVMKKAFEIAGYSDEQLQARFGGMYRALHYGPPPHGGIAPGIDRMVMLLAGVDNLRDVIAFPFNQQAQDLLLGAPACVEAAQLRELHLRLDLPKTKPR